MNIGVPQVGFHYNFHQTYAGAVQVDEDEVWQDIMQALACILGRQFFRGKIDRKIYAK